MAFAEHLSKRAEGFHDESSGDINADALTPDELRIFTQNLGDFYAALLDNTQLSELASDTSLPDPEFEYIHRILQALGFAFAVTENLARTHRENGTPRFEVIDLAEIRHRKLELEEMQHRTRHAPGA